MDMCKVKKCCKTCKHERYILGGLYVCSYTLSYTITIDYRANTPRRNYNFCDGYEVRWGNAIPIEDYEGLW